MTAGLTAIHLHLDGDACWPDLADARDRVIALEAFEIARLPMGTAAGLSSVAMRFDLPDGRVVIVQATLRNLGNALRALEAADRLEADREGKGGA